MSEVLDLPNIRSSSTDDPRRQTAPALYTSSWIPPTQPPPTTPHPQSPRFTQSSTHTVTVGQSQPSLNLFEYISVTQGVGSTLFQSQQAPPLFSSAGRPSVSEHWSDSCASDVSGLRLGQSIMTPMSTTPVSSHAVCEPPPMPHAYDAALQRLVPPISSDPQYQTLHLTTPTFPQSTPRSPYTVSADLSSLLRTPEFRSDFARELHDKRHDLGGQQGAVVSVGNHPVKMVQNTIQPTVLAEEPVEKKEYE